MGLQVGPPAEEPPGEEDPSQEEEDQTFLDHMEGGLPEPDMSGGDFPEMSAAETDEYTPDTGEFDFHGRGTPPIRPGGMGDEFGPPTPTPGYTWKRVHAYESWRDRGLSVYDAISAIEDDEERYKVPDRHHPGRTVITGRAVDGSWVQVVVEDGCNGTTFIVTYWRRGG